MSHIHLIEACPSYSLPNSYTIQGYSRSADRTGFIFKVQKGFNILFDAAVGTYKDPHLILITHTHSDHCFHLPMLLTGFHDYDCDVYVPPESVDVVKNFIDATYKLTTCGHGEKPSVYDFVKPAIPNTQFSIVRKKRTFIIDMIQLDHTVPTVGYVLSHIKHKLKEEYVHLPGKEIGKLRKQGIDITKKSIDKVIAYICDTSIHGFVTNLDILLECPVIMIECTYLDMDMLSMASEHKHILWDQLKPYVVDNPHIKFILIHFSMRYSDEYITTFFQKQKVNITLWLKSEVIDI